MTEKIVAHFIEQIILWTVDSHRPLCFHRHHHDDDYHEDGTYENPPQNSTREFSLILIDSSSELVNSHIHVIWNPDYWEIGNREMRQKSIILRGLDAGKS